MHACGFKLLSFGLVCITVQIWQKLTDITWLQASVWYPLWSQFRYFEDLCSFILPETIRDIFLVEQVCAVGLEGWTGEVTGRNKKLSHKQRLTVYKEQVLQSAQWNVTPTRQWKVDMQDSYRWGSCPGTQKFIPFQDSQSKFKALNAGLFPWTASFMPSPPLTLWDLSHLGVKVPKEHRHCWAAAYGPPRHMSHGWCFYGADKQQSVFDPLQERGDWKLCLNNLCLNTA